MAAHSEQRRRTDVHRVRAQRDGLDQIGRAADGTAHDQRDLVADALLAQSGIDRGECKLDRNAHIIADACRGCARAAAPAVDRDDIRTRPGNARGDGRDVMHGCHLDDDGLAVAGRLLERKDQLSQILDGIDIVMGRGRNRVGALGNHAGLGDVRADLDARQMAADARFCALSHLDLNGCTRAEVVGVYAEATGRDLHDGVVAVGVKVLVQTALAGVVVDAQLLRSTREGCMGVVGDRAVAHRREQDGPPQGELRGLVGDELAVRPAQDAARLLAQKNAGLHGLAQRVDGGIGDLRSVEQQFVPVDRAGLGIAHRREQHAAGLRLLVNLAHGVARPVGVYFIGIVGAHDLERTGRADRDAALAVDALAVVGGQYAELFIEGVHFVCALTHAQLAPHTPCRVACDLIERKKFPNVHLIVRSFRSVSQ